jgi:hypothetical protein
MSLKALLIKKAKELALKLAKKKLGEVITGSKAAGDVPPEYTWQQYVEKIPGKFKSGRQLYRVIKPIRYDCTIAGKTYRVCVPVGFITDLASTPEQIWLIYPPYGTYSIPCILHDYMTGTRLYDFKTSDIIFRHAMRYLPPGTPWRTRTIFYAAVRIAGEKFVYSKHTTESIAKERKFIGSCRREIADRLGRELCPYTHAGECDLPKGWCNSGSKSDEQ